MPGRTSSSVSYRYGFNGKEQDPEISGDGNQYDYGFRIYDPRLGRFKSVDPLTQSYPWYTPYQYAGNNPIQFIDLDGLEKVTPSIHYNPNCQCGYASYPALGPSNWKDVDGATASGTFGAAAKYNTKNNNPGAYQTIEDRHNWYMWAANETRSKGNYWFAAARDVTSSTMVGAADGVNLWFMNDNEEKVLRGANEFLLKENFKNFGKYALGEGSVTWNGKSYGNLSGAALDNQMVVIEMTTLQGYLDQYKKDYIGKNGQDKWNELAKGLNKLFDNKFLSKFTPAANKYAQEEFGKKYGKDAEFDFMNLEHRIFQGQKMAEYLRKEDEKSKQDNLKKTP